MNKILQIPISLLILVTVYPLLHSQVEDNPEEPDTTVVEIFDEETIAANRDKLFTKNSLFAQDLSILLPAFNREERDLFSPGFGGSILLEVYALNRLFKKQTTLPGLILGLTGSLFIYIPVMEEATTVMNSAMFHIGMYTGYQFLFPITRKILFSPAIYAGVKYYFTFHPGTENVQTSNPLAAAGITLNFLFDKTLALVPAVEYQFYFENLDSAPPQTIRFSLGTGILF